MNNRILLGCVATFCTVLGAHAQTDTLTVLYVNDTHSILAPLGPRGSDLRGTQGGMARVATVVARERRLHPNMLLLHAGDFSGGDVLFLRYGAVPELQILRSMGLCAMAAGNHEFDLTAPVLARSLQLALGEKPAFPLLSANLVLPDSSLRQLAKFVHPFLVCSAGPVSVGIFGLTTPRTNQLSRPFPAYCDSNIVGIAAAMVDTLNTQGCDVIVCLSHLGLALDSLIARNVTGISLIIGGHDHAALASPHVVRQLGGDTTWIVQAGSHTRWLGRVQLAVQSRTGRVRCHALIHLDKHIPEDSAVATRVRELIADAERTYGPVYTHKVATAKVLLGEVAERLMARGRKDTPLGDYVTDAFRSVTGTDIAIEPCGSTSMPLYPGPLVAADFFRALGYGFNPEGGRGYRLVTFSIRGKDLLSGLEYGLSDIEHDDEYFIQVSGMTYAYQSLSPPFSRVRRVTIGGKPPAPGDTYTVTANEYVVGFLSALGIPFTDRRILEGTTEVDALLAAARKAGIIAPESAERVANVAPSAPGTHSGGSTARRGKR